MCRAIVEELVVWPLEGSRGGLDDLAHVASLDHLGILDHLPDALILFEGKLAFHGLDELEDLQHGDMDQFETEIKVSGVAETANDQA